MPFRPAETLTIWQAHSPLADPHIASDNKDRLSVLSAIFEALVRRDRQGNYQPLLVERWSLAEDACTWTFSLRPQVHFHNGDLLRAQDVVASLERACDPTLGSDLGTEGLYQSYFKGAHFKPVDAQTVQIITAEPMADALDLLVDIPIVPQRSLADLPGRPVGSGPYQPVSIDSDRIVMRAFDRYWGGPPPAQNLHWQAAPEAGRRVEALLAGQADLISNVPVAYRAAVKAAEQVKLVEAPSSVCATFMCNLFAGVCQDKRVRQALNYALDVPDIINLVMDNTARPINGPLTDLHFGHDPALPPYPHDPALAKLLLAEAGYAGGLRLALDVPTTLPDEAAEVARVMAQQYARVGITTDIREFADRPAYAQMVKAKQIDDACCFDSSPLSTFRPLREKFHAGVAGPWWLGYANPQVDALIDQARATVDTAQRQQIYRRAYGLIRDDAPWIFLYNPSLAWGIGPRAQDWQPDIDGVIRI